MGSGPVTPAATSGPVNLGPEWAWGRYGRCTVVPIDWPYDCDAKGASPTDKVYACVQHHAWWNEPTPEWGD